MWRRASNCILRQRAPWGGRPFVRGADQRWMSSSSASPRVTVSIESDQGIATLTMQSAPVNGLSLEMFQEFSASLKELNKNKQVHSILLQSDMPHVFSAGLQLDEMILDGMNDTNRLVEFWTAFQELYLDLYGSPKTVIGVLEGSAPAAGCMLALSCDYRIMVPNPKYKIGLNESLFGIAAPPFLAQQLVDTIGRRQAELSLWRGTLYEPEHALKLGLVDEVHGEPRKRATELVMTEFSKIPPAARTASQLLIREERLQKLVDNREEDLEQFVGFVTQEKVQMGLKAYLQKLSSSSKGKK